MTPGPQARSPSPRKLLLVEDDEEDFILTRDLLAEISGGRYELDWVESYGEGIERLRNRSYDLCLLDYRLGARTGIEFLEEASELRAPPPVIVLTGAGDDALDRALMEAGASDFLEKGRLDSQVLERSIRYSMEHYRIESAQRVLAEAGRGLAASLDHDMTMGVAARIAVPVLAEWCWIWVDDPRPDCAGTESYHEDEEMETVLRRLAEAPPGLRSSALVHEVLDGRTSLLLPALSPADVSRLVGHGPQRGMLDALDIQSLAIVPLRVREAARGILLLGRSSQRRTFDPRDRTVLDELGNIIALSLLNADLYETAQEALRLRGDLLTMVSHDLGNPLAAVTMVSERLADRLADHEDPKVRNHLEMIRSATGSMVRMVEDLLQVGRAEAGHFTIEVRPSSIVPVIQRAIRQFQERAEEAGVELDSEISLDGRSVELDEVRIMQVVGNLLSNALKFTPRGGRILLEAVESNGEEEVLVSVSDSGPGIEKADLPYLFDRFWQARKLRTGGAGLGLSIAREIVTGHGGRIWAESTPGEGSIFHFTLPVHHRERGATRG